MDNTVLGFHDCEEIALVWPLDSMIGTVPPSRFIKIDVEGHEGEVIAGAHGFLEHSDWPRILVECWSFPWFAASRAEFFVQVGRLGYSIVPVNWPDMFLLERH